MTFCLLILNKFCFQCFECSMFCFLLCFSQSKHLLKLFPGFDSSQPNNKAILPLSTTSDMITFTLASGSLVTLRASGTEPKIKYYIELQTEPGKTEKLVKNKCKNLN